MDPEDVREKALEEAREDIAAEDRDQHIIKAVKQLEEVEKGFDKQMERFRDWYALHFPELEQEIQEDTELLRVLEKGVGRDELGSFETLAESSTGSELAEPEKEMLEELNSSLRSMDEVRQDLEEYIRESSREVMPNLSTLLGPILASKILALEGSIESLARQPASTIQMLGAEKALFRYLRGEGTPPKHGVLFEHPFVSDLPGDERGKMARFLANKSAIAARMDVYGDKRKGDELREEASQKFQELKEN